MPAYVVEIVPPVCVECRKPAAYEVRSAFNEVIGPRCRTHAQALVTKLNAEPRR